MPQVGKINVSVQDLMQVGQTCNSCGEDLYNTLSGCFNELDGLMQEGWESESGEKLLSEFESMGNANFGNYLSSMHDYVEFCNYTIEQYEAAEAETTGKVGGSGLQSLDL